MNSIPNMAELNSVHEISSENATLSAYNVLKNYLEEKISNEE